MSRRRLTAVMIAAVLMPVVFATVASSSDRMPRIHPPKAYGGEFAFVDVYIANSDRHTKVQICVSGYCRNAQRIARFQWTAYAGRVRRGATRRVRVMAANSGRGSEWGEAPVKFR